MTAISAGQTLRDEFDDALVKASKRLGKAMHWDEHERHALDAAAAAADRRADLQQVFDAERNGENRPAVLVKLSAELRLLDKSIADHLSRVRIGPGVAKSQQHQRAAHARWNRNKEA